MILRVVSGFLALALLILLVPLVAYADPAAETPRVGILWPFPSASLEPFRQGLRDHGYLEGQNVAIEYRYAEGRPERFPALAAELVGLPVDVIVTAGPQAAHAAKQATSTIPIVMAVIADPVEGGFVASLARPGGNITGLSFLNTELSAKRLELLKQVYPRLSRLAALWDVTSDAVQVKATEVAARGLGIHVQRLEVRGPEDFGNAFDAAKRGRADALVVLASPFFHFHRMQLTSLAAQYRLPAMYPFKELAQAGGLMAYAPSHPELFRRAATYVDKILRGAKPADLPVEQPTKFELVINLKTAKALGLKIPQSVLIRADQVIQ